jgi:hypothetical protein
MDVPPPETSSLSPESNVSNHADSTSPSNIGDHVFDILLVSQARERRRGLARKAGRFSTPILPV